MTSEKKPKKPRKSRSKPKIETPIRDSSPVVEGAVAAPAPVAETEPVDLTDASDRDSSPAARDSSLDATQSTEASSRDSAPAIPPPLAHTQPVDTSAIVVAAQPPVHTQPVEASAIIDSAPIPTADSSTANVATRAAPPPPPLSGTPSHVEQVATAKGVVLPPREPSTPAIAVPVESSSEPIVTVTGVVLPPRTPATPATTTSEPIMTVPGVVLPPKVPSSAIDPSTPTHVEPMTTERGVMSPALERVPDEAKLVAAKPPEASLAEAVASASETRRSVAMPIAPKPADAPTLTRPVDASTIGTTPGVISDALTRTPASSSSPAISTATDSATKPAIDSAAATATDDASAADPASATAATKSTTESATTTSSTESSKPALSAVPALLDVPALSSPTSSLVPTPTPEPSTAVRVDLREGARRTGDDRRRPDEPTEKEPKATLDDKPADTAAAKPAGADNQTADDKLAAKPEDADDNDQRVAKPADTRRKATGDGDAKAPPFVPLGDAKAPPFERRSGDDRRASEATATAVGEASVYTDPEAATLPEPEVVAQQAPAGATLDPGAAAFEAARIAGEIVGDMSTASGAAIVAAAAAGAAIEAARAQQAAGVSNVVPQAAGAAAAAAVASATTSATAGDQMAPTDGSQGDPVTTVRMQRERILRALAEDIAASPVLAESGTPKAEAQARAASQGERAVSVDGEVAPEEEGLDPVQIAAAAINRLRHRASTDFAELRGHYHRHDLVVLLAALVIIVVAGRIHAGMVTPPNVVFPEHEQDQEALQRGLTFEHSQSWLKAEKLAPWPPRIARDPTGQPPKSSGAYHAALTHSLDPTSRIEVFIDKRPAWTNIVTGLELDRRTRWGELYTLDMSTVEEIGDQNWLRTAYRYAHAAEKGDVPRVDRAVEYATVDREQIYVVTLFGSEKALDRIEEVVAPTLRTPQKQGARSALPLVPQTRAPSHRSYPDAVSRAFDSTVMIVVADLIDGRLVARGGGSGVIVGADGSILTNYHVIHDKNGRLHDVFVIGRFSQLDKAPQLQCAGRPNRSKLQRELDLALVKCDTDLDGRTWTPGHVGVWPTLQEAKSTDVKIGQRLWVLGFPDVGGGGLTMSTGEIGGWTGQDGAAGRDFIKTDASITHGNSGGPAIDDRGRLVGIASASRTKITSTGGVIETKSFGLVRPITTGADLLTIAAIGWTPREGHTDVEIQPSAVEAPAEGIRIATHVIDHANEAPIRDALVMVIKAGVNANEIDVNRLDDQVISWGRSNTQGEVQLKQPVPIGSYTVLVRASGYEPLIGDHRLTLDEKSPPAFDPWGGIRMLAR